MVLSYTTRYGGITNVRTSTPLPVIIPLQNEKNGEMTTNVFMNLVWAWKHSSSSVSLALTPLSCAPSLCPQMDLSLFITTNYFRFYLSYSLTHCLSSLPCPRWLEFRMAALFVTVCAWLWMFMSVGLNDLPKAGESKMGMTGTSPVVCSAVYSFSFFVIHFVFLLLFIPAGVDRLQAVLEPSWIRQH